MSRRRSGEASPAGTSSSASRSANVRNQAGYKRRKDGCLTCRSRRVGCGRERPQCSACSRLSLVCEWPDDSVPPPPLSLPPPLPPPLQQQQHHQHQHQHVQHQPHPSHQQPPPSHAQPFLPLPIPTPPPPPPPPAAAHDTTSSGSDLFATWPTQTTDGFDLDFFSGFFGAEVLDFDLTTEPSVLPVVTLQQPIPLPQIPPAPPISEIRTPVTTSLDDIPFISHFLESIAQTAKVRDTSLKNHYLGLFAASLAYPPLYAGILAWSAWHWAHIGPSGDQRQHELVEYSRRKRNECSHLLTTSITESMGRNYPPSDLEVLLSTIVIHCNYEIITGCAPGSIHGLLKLARTLVAPTGRGIPDQLTPLAQRAAAILTSYDVRASLFGLSTAEYTIQLTDRLFSGVESPIPTPSLSSWSNGSATLLRLNRLYAQTIRIERDYKDGKQRGDAKLSISALHRGTELYGHLESLGAIFDPPALDQLSSATWDPYTKPPALEKLVSQAFLACLYNELIIYLSRVLGVPTPERSIDRIVTVAYNLALSYEDVSQTIFPRQLFFAALETSKPEQFNWVVEKLGELSHSGGGVNVVKTPKLLVMLRNLEKDGVKQDLAKVMDSAEFRFVL